MATWCHFYKEDLWCEAHNESDDFHSSLIRWLSLGISWRGSFWLVLWDSGAIFVSVPHKASSVQPWRGLAYVWRMANLSLPNLCLCWNNEAFYGNWGRLTFSKGFLSLPLKFNLADEFPYSFVRQEITPNDLDNGVSGSKVQDHSPLQAILVNHPTSLHWENLTSILAGRLGMASSANWCLQPWRFPFLFACSYTTKYEP